MADINALKTAFFVNLGDVVQAAEKPVDPDIPITAATLPLTAAGCKVTHLIDGTNYFNAIQLEIDRLLAGGTDRFFYTNSWSLGTTPTPGVVEIGEGTFTSAWRAEARQFVGAEPAFELQDGTPPYRDFYYDIEDMVNKGVDVRLMVWASPFLVNLQKAANVLINYWAINVHSLLSVADLRSLRGMNEKVVLNVLGHTLGAMHLKMVVCGDSTGFRGYAAGIDFAQSRNASPVHAPGRNWHDAGIKVEGPAANGLYNYFEQMWNEQLRRTAKTFKAFGVKIKSHLEETPRVPPKITPPITGGTQHVQILRTLPTMNFSVFRTERVPLSCVARLVAGFKQKKLSFAEEGIFEFRAAQRKAIDAAREFIYIEDQAFYNLELAGWINARLLAVPALKVILMYMPDPLDSPNPLLPDLMDALITGVAAPEDRVVFAVAPYTIHSKLTIIDDKWAAVGSSNCMRRSFYMDGEISISVLDEVEPSLAKNLRKDLWGEHCNETPGPACDPLLPLDDALGIWRAGWGSAPAGFTLRHDIALKRVPFAYEPTPTPADAFPAPRPATLDPAYRDAVDGDSRLEY